jgi:hypothetical protein
MADELTEGREPDTSNATEPTPETQSTEQTDAEKARQAELDRAVTKALETARRKWQREQEDQLAEEKRRAAEKLLAEQGKFKELAEAREAELAALRADAAAKDLAAKTSRLLADRKLTGLQPLFDADLSTMEGRAEAADVLQRTIDEVVEARVVERLRSPNTPRGTGTTSSGSTSGGSLAAQLQAAQRASDWAQVALINDQMMDALHEKQKAS